MKTSLRSSFLIPYIIINTKLAAVSASILAEKLAVLDQTVFGMPSCM
jgi:hypothetical protein